MSTQLYSQRGIPLLHDGEVRFPLITVEIAPKWYSLWLIGLNSSPVPIGYDVLEDYRGDESAYLDHAPNPKAVAAFAAAQGIEVDEMAYEMMIGRWEQEYHGRYLPEG